MLLARSRSLSSSVLVSSVVGVLALTSCRSCDPEVGVLPGIVEGQACDPDTGAGLPGALVVLAGGVDEQRVQADGLGRFRFARIAPGTYSIAASLDDIERTFDAIDVKSDATSSVIDEACRPQPVDPGGGSVAGQICNRHTGELVSDADVLVLLGNGEQITGRTDATGRFDIDGIPAGDVIVTIRGAGFQRSFAVTIVEGEEALLDLAESCDAPSATSGGIVGHFCDPVTNGNLIGAEVTARLINGTGESVTDVTDTDGNFEVGALVPGTYRVDVSHPNSSFTQPQVVVVAGEIAQVTDPAACGTRPAYGRIQGKICDEDAGGRFHGDVELLTTTNQHVADATSDEEGRFEFTLVTPGTYTIRATRPGYERVFTPVVVEAFQTKFLEEENCPAGADICTSFTHEPEVQADGRILLVVDKSGSMGLQANGFNGPKWDATKGALVNVTQSLDANVEFGLVLYPQDQFCGIGFSAQPVAPHNAAAIAATLNATTPSGGTPTAATLGIARDILVGLPRDNRPIAVVLATDGGPNCNEGLSAPCTCTTSGETAQTCSNYNCLDDTNAIQAVGRIRDLGVQTHVVGIAGAESFATVLNSMAVVGGAPRNDPVTKYYEATSSADLESALQAITRRIFACTITVAEDLTTATSVSAVLGTQTLPQDITRRNGWDIIDAHTIQLFGSVCQSATDSQQNVVVTRCARP